MDSEKKNVYAKLFAVQQKLRVPKDRKNSFGGYDFRNAADILEKAKPYLEEVRGVVTLSDEIYTCTSRHYVRSTAEFIDIETGEKVTVNAEAREDETKRGMDAAQLTGACSSYARKYALCGLFAIDDSRLDPDESDTHGLETRGTAAAQSVNAASALKAKAKEAWSIFKANDAVKSMDENSRSKFFFATLKSKVGKEDPARLSLEDWEKVIGELDMMRAK